MSACWDTATVGPSQAMGLCVSGPTMVWEVSLSFYQFLERVISPIVMGPLWLSPTVDPEPLQGYPEGSAKSKLSLGLFSLLDVCDVSWGHASAPRGCSPRSHVGLYTVVQGFYAELPIREAFVSAGLSDVSASLGDPTSAERH
jgi:hypothetical protein